MKCVNEWNYIVTCNKPKRQTEKENKLENVTLKSKAFDSEIYNALLHLFIQTYNDFHMTVVWF